MSILAVITVIVLSPFMAISFLPALKERSDEEERQLVQWRKKE